MATIALFTSQATDGQSSAFKFAAGRSHPEGAFAMTFGGTFNGVTVKLQHSCDGGSTWADVADGSFTATGSAGAFTMRPGEQFRLDLSGTGSPAPSVNANASGAIETA